MSDLSQELSDFIAPLAKETLSFLEPPTLPSALSPFSYLGLGDFPIEEKPFESDVFQFIPTQQTMLIEPKRDLITGEILSYSELPISTLPTDISDMNRRIGTIDNYHRGSKVNVPLFSGMTKPEPKSAKINFQPLIESLDSGMNLLMDPFSDIVENSAADQDTSESLPELPTIGEATVVPDPRADLEKKSDEFTQYQCIVDNLQIDDIHQLIPKMAYDFKFKLDDFQARSIYRVENHQSVFVAAPTSAGKTVVAQYAIALCRLHKMRVIYTSPIKALSNQKFRDFTKDFGDVGIITGDVSINREASILIMTTEILRSMLYRGADVLRDVECVIFDECHYISDVERGVVWEESIILMPPHINMVFLSATMPNCNEIASWIARTKHRPVYVEYHDQRPVPLSHSLYVHGKVFPIATPSKSNSNKADFNSNKYKEATRFWTQPDKSHRKTFDNRNPFYWQQAIQTLKETKMLPALIFSFSIANCEKIAGHVKNSNLLTKEERSKVTGYFNNAISRLDESNRRLPQIQMMFELVQNGIGIHHGGILPILKEIVELLLTDGLLKVLICTSTFAMGINVPARTCAFTSLYKFNGKEMAHLQMSEYLQMSGRAGRRGLDKVGSSILLIAKEKDREFPSEDELRQMFCGKAEQLESQFRIRFNMILSIIRVEGMNLVELLKRSLNANKIQSELPKYKKKADLLVQELHGISKIQNCPQVTNQTPSDDIEDIELGTPIKDFVRLADEFSVVNKKLLQSFDKKLISYFVPGYFVLYVTSQRCELGLIQSSDLSKLDSNSATITLYLGAHGSLTIRSMNDIYNIHLLAPSKENIHLVRDETRRLLFDKFNVAEQAIPYNQILKNNAYEFQQDSIKHHKLLMEIVASPCFKCASLSNHYKISSKAHQLRKQLVETREKFKDDKIQIIPLLNGYLKMLKTMGYNTEDRLITIKGRAAIEMSSADEIISTELLYNGFFDDLTPQQIAAFASCLVVRRRPKPEEMPELDDRDQELLSQMIKTANDVLEIMDQYGVPNDDDYVVMAVNPQYLPAVYMWSDGKTFNQVMNECASSAKILEGNLVRIILNTHELLKNFSNAAQLLSLKTLTDKFDAAAESIKRDIIFAGSLYLD